MYIAKQMPKAIIFLTFLLIILGGVVHNTESSLACPDWPLCYGQLMPKMEGGILIEHSHRMLATLVGFLTLIFFLITFFSKKIELKKYSSLSGLCLFLVIVQGILGGITVIYKLPTVVSSTHLGLAMIFFLSIIYLDFKVNNESKLTPQLDQLQFRHLANMNEWCAILLGLSYFQILLGAFMRHSGAGAACGLGIDSTLVCNDYLVNGQFFWPFSPGAQVHMLHRYFAVFLTLLSSTFVYWCFKVSRNFSINWRVKIQKFSIAFFIALFIQILLGILVVAYRISPLPTTLHLAGAAILLLIIWRFFLSTLNELQKEGKSRYSYLSDLFEMTKPKLTLLVVATTFAGILLTPVELHPVNVLLILLSMYFIVSGAGVLNCYLEHHVDANMDRTKERPLPANRFSRDHALLSGIILNLGGTLLLFIQSNAMTTLLAILSTVIYLFAYTPLKRTSPYALFVGALPGALPSVIGWTSVTNSVDVTAICIGLVLALWQIPHFIAISIKYMNDYSRAGLLVFPNKIGLKKSIFIAVITSALLLAASIAPVYFSNFSLIYLYGAACLSFLFFGMNMTWLFLQTNSSIMYGAQLIFWASIAYLPLLMGAMIFFK